MTIKMAKIEEDIELSDEPRSIRDPVKFNRLRIMIEEEAIKPTWGCPLYIAARPGGWLTGEQREAGDKYQQAAMDHAHAQQTDPEDMVPEARELAYRRIEVYRNRWTECVKILGRGRKAVDRLVLEEYRLSSESERMIARDGLQLLANFFNTGKNKRAT
jgi:hypothetical protein